MYFFCATKLVNKRLRSLFLVVSSDSLAIQIMKQKFSYKLSSVNSLFVSVLLEFLCRVHEEFFVLVLEILAPELDAEKFHAKMELSSVSKKFPDQVKICKIKKHIEYRW